MKTRTCWCGKCRECALELDRVHRAIVESDSASLDKWNVPLSDKQVEGR